MADALVSIALQKIADALVSIALQKIGNAVRQQLDMFAGVALELERLRDGFRFIQALLSDAESRQVVERYVCAWLSRLKHVCYDINDVLDEWKISWGLGEEEEEEEEERDDDEGDGSNKVCACLFSCSNSCDRVVYRNNVASRIKEIRERLDQIAVEGNIFSFRRSSPLGGDHRMLVRSTSLINESEIFTGRDNDKETVINSLVSGSSQVVAIVGIGGLGKTTLARLIYHDERVWNHFNQALYWARASEPFDVTRLTKGTMEEVKKTSTSRSGFDALQEELRQLLGVKRYLLVLDDVQNDDAEKLKMLLLTLTSATGSAILVTTCSHKVANTMNAYIHELNGLSDDQSWTLFCSRAFAGREDDRQKFESIGKEIVSECKGVPLSIKAIGSVMNTKRNAGEWENVLKSKMWSLPKFTDKVLPALLLTYCNLPPHLKICFAYCSMFPKDYELEKDVLVRLWVAQGFIQSGGNREEEDIASEYFDELVAWSMLQEIEENYGVKITCKMHDLLHDLAQFIAQDEIYAFINSSGSISNVRHAFLSFADSDNKPSDIPVSIRRARKLRTLWLRGIDRSDHVIVDLLRQAKFLRALSFMDSKSTEKTVKSSWIMRHLRCLDFSKCSEKTVKLPWIMRHLRCLDFSGSDKMELPDAIWKMRHLRYLDFSGSDTMALPNVIGKMKYLKYLNLSYLNIAELPESASHLRNLHTLNLTGCVKLKSLLESVSHLCNLHILDLSGCVKLKSLPESVSHLRNLHTLNLTGCLKLKRLPRAMGGMVSLRHLEIERTDSLECLPEGLGRIRGLRSLSKFIVGGGEEGGCQIDELRNLNSLQEILRIQHLDRVSSREEAETAQLWKKPHLRRLVLSRSGQSVVEGLRPHFNLEELKLFWYTGSNLPDWTGLILCLRKLELCGCLRLEGLLHHLDGFSIIEELIIRDCPRIEGIASSSSCVYLERISVIDSCEFFSSGLPHLRNLKTFEIRRFRKETLPDGGWERYRALQTLEIWDCDELKSLPDELMHLQSLENLIIHGCDKLEQLPEGLGQLKKLKSLIIGVLKALTCLPGSLEQLESLEHLEVSSCKKLESLSDGLQQLFLRSLKTFKICSFINETLPRGGWKKLEALQTLEIRNCSELKSLPDGLTELVSLENLIICGCDKLERLPERLEQLEKLMSLTIGVLKALRWLPNSLEQLESLKHLEVSSCKELVSLPHGLRHLWRLSICGCPLLSERYKREGGVGWPHISHIPIIQIDKQRIQ